MLSCHKSIVNICSKAATLQGAQVSITHCMHKSKNVCMPAASCTEQPFLHTRLIAGAADHTTARLTPLRISFLILILQRMALQGISDGWMCTMQTSSCFWFQSRFWFQYCSYCLLANAVLLFECRFQHFVIHSTD